MCIATLASRDTIVLFGQCIKHSIDIIFWPLLGSTVELRLSELMWGRGVRIIEKYVKLNTYAFIYRALLNYSNKAYTS